jgi:non-ribosomal peptide synthetase component F
MNTVGVFLNPILVISRMDDAQTFQQVIRRIHGEIQELLHHQAHPMEFVLDRLGVQSYSAPFAFNMLNLPNFSEQAMLSDFRDYRRYDVPAAKFQMELYVVEYLNGIEMFWSFDGRYYDMPMMEYIGNEYVRLIRLLSSNSSSLSVTRRTLALPGNFGEVDAQ